ncbi:MAG: metallophosphoesterase [Lachnospiraceae bacterium]|nr:metallophosphoesterase [Lachnospiraceae bacterium]
MAWTLLIVSALAILIAAAIYMTRAVGRFRLIGEIDNKRKRRLVSFGILAFLFLLCTLLLSFINAVAVFLHATFFFLFTGLVVRLVEKRRGRSFRINWQGWIALPITTVYLLIAAYCCFHVWQTEYTLQSDKLSAPVRIAMISDVHLNTTFDGEGFAAHLETIREQQPDLLLVVGDFVDDGTRREDMIRACAALGSVEAPYGVWFSYGNHDRGYRAGNDFSWQELEQELTKNSVRILEDEIAYAGELCIVGRADKRTQGRKELAELLEGVDSEKYIVVMDHQPSDYARSSETFADLVVSGHTHGGQLFPITFLGEWLGMNDRTYGYEKRGNVNFIVTSGISNWALYFKSGTTAEYVLIDVTPEDA